MMLPGRNFLRSEAKASKRRCSALQTSKKSACERIVAASSSCIPASGHAKARCPARRAGHAKGPRYRTFPLRNRNPFRPLWLSRGRRCGFRPKPVQNHRERLARGRESGDGTERKETLRDEAVAAFFGNEQPGIGGIALDLLAQPVDVGLERVGRHPV